MKDILDFKYMEHGKDTLNHKKHSHDNCYEILLINSADGVFMIKDQLFPLKSGALFLINGMEIHCSAPRNPQTYVRSKLIISSSYINDLAKLSDCFPMIDELFIHNGGICIQLSGNEYSSAEAIFLEIKEALKDNNLYTNIKVSNALFWLLILAHQNKNLYTPLLNNKISDVLQYINNHIEQKINLEDICNYIHTSKYYLCHIFKSTTNMTISDYILYRRVSIAKKNMLYTQKPLAEIAMSAGFSSFSYFSKIFKKNEGITPNEFRKKHLPVNNSFLDE